jgi:hypothetical protein
MLVTNSLRQATSHGSISLDVIANIPGGSLRSRHAASKTAPGAAGDTQPSSRTADREIAKFLSWRVLTARTEITTSLTPVTYGCQRSNFRLGHHPPRTTPLGPRARRSSAFSGQVRGRFTDGRLFGIRLRPVGVTRDGSLSMRSSSALPDAASVSIVELMDKPFPIDSRHATIRWIMLLVMPCASRRLRRCSTTSNPDPCHEHERVAKSPAGGACTYAIRLWKRLTCFLEYPELEPSNNLAENSMRPVATGPKNWIHLGSQQA